LTVDLSKILVAIDGSEHSDYALNIAVKIGEKYSSCIDLVHVELQTSGAASSIKKADNILSDRVDIVKERKLACNQINIQSNDPAAEILKLLDSGRYSLVVLGARGLSGLKTLLMGSVSSKVAKESKSSVLVVKNKIESIPKILFGYDGSEEGSRALDFALDMGVKFGAKVDVVTVLNMPLSGEGYLGTEVDKWIGEVRTSLASAVAKLKSNGLESQGKILDQTNVALALAGEAERGSYDILIIRSKGFSRLKRLVLGSVTNGIVSGSKTSVLIVR
jgi:nucleotide-binding universal stress UspA family protein